MKHIKEFEGYEEMNPGGYLTPGDEITCGECDHSWRMEEEDEHPYLCHTCGYDSEEGEYNYEELERFWMSR